MCRQTGPCCPPTYGVAVGVPVPVWVCYGELACVCYGCPLHPSSSLSLIFLLQYSCSCLASASLCRSLARRSPSLVAIALSLPILSIRATTASPIRDPYSCIPRFSVCRVGTSALTRRSSLSALVYCPLSSPPTLRPASCVSQPSSCSPDSARPTGVLLPAADALDALRLASPSPGTHHAKAKASRHSGAPPDARRPPPLRPPLMCVADAVASLDVAIR